jgi:hypothetical protein
MSDLEHTPSGHRWFAATYDLITKPGEKRLGKLRRDLLADLVGDVLEIGAGTGANFEHYPPAFGSRARARPHMLARPEAAAGAGRADIDVRSRYGAATSRRQSFDVVVATLCFALCTIRRARSARCVAYFVRAASRDSSNTSVRSHAWPCADAVNLPGVARGGCPNCRTESVLRGATRSRRSTTKDGAVDAYDYGHSEITVTAARLSSPPRRNSALTPSPCASPPRRRAGITAKN